MKTFKNFLIWGAGCILFIASVCALYSHTERNTVVVGRVDMQQMISSTDGNVSTEYDCKVYTNAGVFRVMQSGILFPHPELISRLHEGDTVTVVSRGRDIPQIGMYRIIVDVECR